MKKQAIALNKADCETTASAEDKLAIDAVRRALAGFREVTRGAVKAEKVYVMPSGRRNHSRGPHYILLGKKEGTWTSSSPLRWTGRSKLYLHALPDYEVGQLKALVRLGLLTKEQLSTFVSWHACARHEARHDMALAELKADANRLGYRLVKAS